MIGGASPDAQPGDFVAVFDKAGQRFGSGLWNPPARVPLRMVHYGTEHVGEEHLDQLLERAVDLREKLLGLGAEHRSPTRPDSAPSAELAEHAELAGSETAAPSDAPAHSATDAYRVISSDGDQLSGLTVDRYGDTLSVEVHSLGVYQRLPKWLAYLHQRLGTKREVVEVEDFIARIEGIDHTPPADTRPAKIREHGVRYEVDFESGHKTGFFCDQRENRFKLAQMVKGARVLDLCCYTGGFALAAKVLGGATDVTGVDLDEKAIAQAKRNANLNHARIDWVHCDAFSFARQMQRNSQKFPVVILDPPKFVASREDELEGKRKYEDLSGMGMQVLEPGGLLVTCSCSGLVDMEEFERLVGRAAYRVGRRLQILDRTGAGADHPVMMNCPESRYLKVIWARVW
ncbi:MAG: class I SAM-dependent rRNA methyltransferase [Verrucomicrobia bacterium]|nr:class I SAM-dependent rRNA methyltransferase [Verrucomicrobiota bacterium]